MRLASYLLIKIDVLVVDWAFVKRGLIVFLQCFQLNFSGGRILRSIDGFQCMMDDCNLSSALMKQLSLVKEILSAIDQAREDHENRQNYRAAKKNLALKWLEFNNVGYQREADHI